MPILIIGAGDSTGRSVVAAACKNGIVGVHRRFLPDLTADRTSRT